MHSRFILRYLYLNVRIIEFNLPSVTKHTGVFLILTRTFTTNKTFSSINKFQRHCTIFWIEILTTAIIIIKKINRTKYLSISGSFPSFNVTTFPSCCPLHKSYSNPQTEIILARRERYITFAKISHLRICISVNLNGYQGRVVQEAMRPEINIFFFFQNFIFNVNTIDAHSRSRIIFFLN